MRISTTHTATVELEGNPGDVLTIDAEFDVEGEYFKSRRGTVVWVGLEFLRAQFGGLTITRDMAEAICGAECLRRIEERVEEEYVRTYYPECAA